MAKRSTAEQPEEFTPTLHPRFSEHLIAHEAAEKQLLSLINARRLPHALLLAGPHGVGKATLAYRLARFLLAPAEAAGNSLFGDALPSESLYLPHTHPTFRRIIAGGHPDLLVIESEDIRIEEARAVAGFLSLTPAESEWKVVIIDSADAMNRNAANALLKTLEEPPPQTVLILISHNPGRLLPTIRSRCRTLHIPPLNEANFIRIMAAIASELTPQESHVWALLSSCSPGVALQLMESKADALYRELLELLATPDTLKLHAFADRLARKDNEEWQAFARLLPWLLSRIAEQKYASIPEVFPGEQEMLSRLHGSKPLDLWTQLWEKATALLADTQRLYLDRKQTILTLLRAIAE
jgi:DNA polymerase-3 subunit delta'